MGKTSSPEPELPERYLDGLGRRLNRHRLWNCLLGVFPPLLLLAYIVAVLFLFDRVGFGVLLFSTAAIVGVGLAVVLHFKTTLPESEKLGQLIDERVDGKEHFRTLATINPARARPSVLAELRSQATWLLRRVNIKRDFPYRVRRGSALSLILSVLTMLVIHLLLAHPVLSVPNAAGLKNVSALAQQFSRESGLDALALGARQAAGQGTALAKKVMRQVRARVGSGSQAGQQDGQGQGSSGKNKSETGAGNSEQHSSAETRQALGKGQEQGQAGQRPDAERGDGGQPSKGEQGERDPRTGSRKGKKGSGPGGVGGRDDAGERDRLDARPKDQAKRKKGNTGSRKPSEDIPQGKEPDRFHPPGAGGEGVKGARFVTVALPKALSTGGGEPLAAGKQGNRSKTRVPVSNVPLPPRAGPETAGEKQHMPREYKGLIK